MITGRKPLTGASTSMVIGTLPCLRSADWVTVNRFNVTYENRDNSAICSLDALLDNFKRNRECLPSPRTKCYAVIGWSSYFDTYERDFLETVFRDLGKEVWNKVYDHYNPKSPNDIEVDVRMICVKPSQVNLTIAAYPKQR